MTFAEIIPALLSGKRVKRKDWPDQYAMQLISRNYVTSNLHTSHREATDWEIVNEETADTIESQ